MSYIERTTLEPAYTEAELKDIEKAGQKVIRKEYWKVFGLAIPLTVCLIGLVW